MWLINLLGLLLVALIVWWFWLYKTRSVAVQAGRMRVEVANGVYQPARIQLPANQAAVLEFVRKDASPCAETVVFPTLQLSEQLHLNKSTLVQLPALQPGVYPFHCQMQMYRGELNVLG